MPHFARLPYLFALLLGISLPATAADKKTPPPVVPASPAMVESVTFQLRNEGQNSKIVVNTSPKLWRFDMLDEGYSVVYNPKTEDYLGLEHRNYTYWQFSWPEVRAAVSNTKRYQSRISDLNTDSSTSDAPAAEPSTNTPPNAAPASDTPDSSGYVWHQTTEKKQIAGVDCVRWSGDTVSGENVEVWCSTVPLPKVQEAMDHLRLINDPMALVPVRTLVPPLVFTIYSSIVRSGVTPLLMVWGGDRDKNHFSFISTQDHEVKPEFFTIPKLYVKTTLITMDGIFDEKEKK